MLDRLFAFEELCLILARPALATWAGLLSVRRRTPGPLARACLVVLPLAVLLPPIVMVAWK